MFLDLVSTIPSCICKNILVRDARDNPKFAPCEGIGHVFELVEM